MSKNDNGYIKPQPVPPTHWISGVDLTSPKHKSVISIPPGLIVPETRVIEFHGQLFVRDDNWPATNERGWVALQDSQILKVT